MSTRTKPQPARNYGARNEGGNAYAMGEELNRELKAEWRNLRDDMRLAKSYRVQYGEDHPDAKRWVSQSMSRVRLLCRIRHAGRVSIWK